MHVNGNASTVVSDLDPTFFGDKDIDVIAVTR
jgi:hypothetical protein